MKQQFIVGVAGVFSSSFYRDNRRITPTSAQLTVYKPGGAAKLIDNAAMSIAQDGLVSYGLTTADNTQPGCDYKAVVTYTYAGVVCYGVFFYDVVASRLIKTIIDDDIIAELPQIKESGWKVRGKAEAGSATTIVDSELKRYQDGYFTGGNAYSIDKDETREIAGFASSSGTITTVEFSAAISTDRYVLTRSYSREIDRAFEKIEERLRRAGKRPHLVLDAEDLREVHIMASTAEVCKGMITEIDGLWWGLWKDYEKKTDDAFAAMNFKYDATGDGFISGVERAVKAERLKAVRR